MRREPESQRKRCIYCLEVKSFCANSKKHSEFNKEHVLHAAFADFSAAPILVGRVCSKCNQLFGDTIDLELGRGGFEALLRLIKGQKEPEGHMQLKRRNYEFTASPDDPEDCLAGLRMQLNLKNGTLVVEPILQIGFLNKETNRWEWFTDGEYLALDESLHPNLNFKRYQIHGPTEEEQQRLFDKVKERYLDAKIDGYVDGKQMPVYTTCITNKSSMRAIAKISFNYLAYITEAISPEIIFLPDFDVTRNFIRHGTGQGPDFVKSSLMPLIVGETKGKARTDSHIVTLDYARVLDRRVIVSDVALFNYTGWEVLLAGSYKGLEYALTSIHTWDWRSKVFQKQVSLKKDGTLSNWIP